MSDLKYLIQSMPGWEKASAVLANSWVWVFASWTNTWITDLGAFIVSLATAYLIYQRALAVKSGKAPPKDQPDPPDSPDSSQDP